MPANRLNGHHAAPAIDLRLPPHNLEAERGTLGSILLDNATLFDVIGVLEPEDFYRDAHQAVYRGLRDMIAAGRSADSITLIAELERRGVYERIGGDDTIAEIVNGVPHAARVMEYAAIVADLATLRRLIEASNGILRAAYDKTRTPDDVVQEAERAIYEVGSRSLQAEVAPAGDCLDDVMDGIVARVDGDGEGTKTGLSDLDAMLHGFRPGEVTVLAARPGMGKTSIALEIAARVADAGDGGPVLFLSLEMGRKELVERLLVQRARVDGDDLRDGGAKTVHALERIERSGAREFVRSVQIQIDDVPTRTATQAAGLVRRAASRGPLRLVVIDYLQLLTVDKESRRSLNREQQVAEISRLTKIAARECRVPILMLAQLNRESEKRADNRPLMIDLRESGAIEQDADVVLMLYRESYHDPAKDPNIAEILVRKNRHGRQGTAKVFFDPRCGRWDNLARHHGDGGPF